MCSGNEDDHWCQLMWKLKSPVRQTWEYLLSIARRCNRAFKLLLFSCEPGVCVGLLYMHSNIIMSLLSSFISSRQASSNWTTGSICKTKGEMDECVRITIPLPLVESMLVVKIEKCSIAKSCSFLSAPFFGFTSFIATMCGFSREISSISSHFFVAVNWSAFVYDF